MAKLPRTHEIATGSTEGGFRMWLSEFREEALKSIEIGLELLGKERDSRDTETSFRIYPIPPGTKAGDRISPKAWIQSAGTAQRLTVEFKRQEVDGVYRQYVLGHFDSDPERVFADTITFGEHTLTVMSTEVLTAEEATTIFQYYYDHDTIPDGWRLRELPEYADYSEAKETETTIGATAPAEGDGAAATIAATVSEKTENSLGLARNKETQRRKPASP